jgi:hypothetical protein
MIVVFSQNKPALKGLNLYFNHKKMKDENTGNVGSGKGESSQSFSKFIYFSNSYDRD